MLFVLGSLILDRLGKEHWPPGDFRARRLHEYRWKYHAAVVFIMFIILVVIEWEASDLKFKSSLLGAVFIQVVPIFVLVDIVVMTVMVNPDTRKGLANTDKLTINQRAAVAFSVLLLLGFMFIQYLDVFAASLFPAIPEQFGGGRPKRVEIVFTQEGGN